MSLYDQIDAKSALRRHVAHYADGVEDFGEDRATELATLLERLEAAFPGDASAEARQLKALADVAFLFAGAPIAEAATARLLADLEEL